MLCQTGHFGVRDGCLVVNYEGELLIRKKQEDVMAVEVDVEKCTGCGSCVDICPVDTIKLDNEIAVIDSEACTECGSCVDECPNEAISLVD